MTICVSAATGEGLSAPAFGHFGSAPYFVVHDPARQSTIVVENESAHTAHGGCQPLGALDDHGVDRIIVGGIGARAIQRLNASGVTVYRAIAGSVRENLERLASGTLEEMAPESGCAGHHGEGEDHDCG